LHFRLYNTFPFFRNYATTNIKKNFKKNFHWYQKAAESGFVDSMHNLVLCYNNGERMEKDLGKAFYWYQKAAEGGNVKAMHSLAFCYYNGERTEKDLGKAFTSFKKQQKVDL
jgi:TPR repeat protein